MTPDELKTKTLEQLQALAYNNIKLIQAYTAGLDAIEKEIASRPTTPPKKEEKQDVQISN